MYDKFFNGSFTASANCVYFNNNVHSPFVFIFVDYFVDKDLKTGININFKQ